MSTRRKPQRTPPPWEPMYRARRIPKTRQQMEAMMAAAERDGVTREELAAVMDEDSEVWRNNRYTVHVDRYEDGAVSCLSIRRDDRKAIHDWRHFQRIKNEIAGENVEGVEIYPAEDRLVDTANQYFIWCLPPGQRVPIGFPERKVQGPAEAAGYGAVQRAF